MKKIALIYFNNCWNVYCEGDEVTFRNPTESFTVRSDNSRSGEWRLRKHDGQIQIPLYTFGYMADRLEARPGHGGEWSSRSSIVNEVFGVQLMEIAYNRVSCAVLVSDLQRLIGDQAQITPVVSGGETHFEVINPKTKIIEL